MQEKKRKEWKDLTHLQQETLRAFSAFHYADEELYQYTKQIMEDNHELCMHAIGTTPITIYGWKICKSCLMQLFKIRKDLIKKEKAHVPTREVERNILESANAQTHLACGEESGAEGNQPKI